MEGLHQHVPKGYIYLPMGFALLVELLQMRYEHNRKLKDIADLTPRAW
jgi:predicted tellurium resistance membrane protein TerC